MERVAAAHRLGRELHEWRESLPPHLGTIKPSSLVPSLRRQAIALRLAYSHAIMHANRPFLLGIESNSQVERAALNASIAECIASAKTVLETIDSMTADGTIFHALWWSHYVSFCAISIAYVWEIQQRTRSGSGLYDADLALPELFSLAERCQSHLARATAEDSASRRYSIILEELRLEARQELCRDGYHNLQMASDNLVDRNMQHPTHNMMPFLNSGDQVGEANTQEHVGQTDSAFQNLNLTFLNEWQTTDWLDLDSSVCHKSIQKISHDLLFIGIWSFYGLQRVACALDE
jgi:hypothetical protein